MTVSYTGDVGNASSFGCFNKILLRWRGSVYKLIYKELLAYISLYLVINLTYRLVSHRAKFSIFPFNNAEPYPPWSFWCCRCWSDGVSVMSGWTPV